VALSDSLTGIANRRAFFDRGGALLDWAIVEWRPTTLLLFDLDRFKEIITQDMNTFRIGVNWHFSGPR
jgi:GGDEF domain-containing protein